MSDTRFISSSITSDLRSGWKQLAATDLLYKVIAFVALTPFVGILLRVILAVSGNSLLADQDILFFFLGPVGWLCAITVGGLWLGIVALEQATLMAVLCANHAGRRISLRDALHFSRTKAAPVLGVAARVIGFAIAAAAPFAILAGLTYLLLLSEYDINYYLKEQPPEFLLALGIGFCLAASMAVILLWIATGWFFSLPLVLFEGLPPAAALRESRRRARGNRRSIVLWIVIWAAVTVTVSGVATSVVVFVGQLFVPHAASSLPLLAAAVGVTLSLSAAANLAVNLASTTSFAAILFNLFRQCGRESDVSIDVLGLSDVDGASFRYRLTTPRLIAGCCLGLLAATAFGAITMRSVRLEDDTRVIAHRGASTVAPENTMSAFRRAVEDGAGWIELDVQLTSDGQVAVFHDSDFMKLAGVNLKIWDATAEDLQNIDIGSWFAAEFDDERVPDLGKVLDECKGKAGVLIELKYYGQKPELEDQLVSRVIEVVEHHEMEDQIEIMSLNLQAVQEVKRLRPNWRAGFLLSVSAGDLNNSAADFLAVNAGFADRSFITSTHKLKKDAYVWTVNDAASMSVMIGRGVDGLITDEPALAQSVLDQRASMSPAERLLIELSEILGVEPQIDDL